jgi:hypothetical protein
MTSIVDSLKKAKPDFTTLLTSVDDIVKKYAKMLHEEHSQIYNACLNKKYNG